MSLFQNVVALFCGFSIVACVSSHIFGAPTEVTAVTKAVKGNDFYHIIMSALLQRVNMDYIYDGETTAREKKSTEAMAVAAQIPPGKLLNLLVLAFRNMFSTEPVDEDPPLKPQDAAITIAKMIATGLAGIKENISKP